MPQSICSHCRRLKASCKCKRQPERRKNRELRKRYNVKRWNGRGGLRQRVGDRDNWICQACGEPCPDTAEIDHIQLATPENFWDMTNLQTLCKSCHSEKTNRERRAGK